MFATSALSRPLRRLELATAGSVQPELKPRGPGCRLTRRWQIGRSAWRVSSAAHSRRSPEAEVSLLGTEAIWSRLFSQAQARLHSRRLVPAGQGFPGANSGAVLPGGEARTRCLLCGCGPIGLSGTRMRSWWATGELRMTTALFHSFDDPLEDS
jgi:hypothetical protein